jgi:integrase
VDEDEDVVRAVDFWMAHGKPKGVVGDVRLDDAVEAFKAWVANPKTPLRPRTKDNLRTRLAIFNRGMGNVPLRAIDADALDAWLASRGTTPRGRKNDLLVVSRFLSWCGERPRRWIEANPARLVKFEKGALRLGTPEVFTLREILGLLAAAKRYRGGLLVPYVALGLFGAVRPDGELARLTWDQLNFGDSQLTIPGEDGKTHRARTIPLEGPLRTWLEWAGERGHKVFIPPNFQRQRFALRKMARLTRWPVDVLRHTGVSHFFRKTGSYGLCAEWAGNSEAIIKAHYQGRVTTAETAVFWTLHPEREQRRKARSG